MPTIDPSLVPSVSPGSIFSRFTTDSSLNIRWLTATDPVFFEALNRPDADIVVRQLILAKAIDTLNVRLGHQAVFPFIIQPQLDLGTSFPNIPTEMIWDLHVSLPAKWQDIRLAKIKRISGSNPGGTTGGSEEYDGRLRFIFTARTQTSSSEVAVFMADYQIDSNLTFQRARVDIVTTSEESVAIGSGESGTVSGFIIFKTLDTSDSINQAFFDHVAPPADTTTDSSGLFLTSAEYELKDNDAGGSVVEDDFSLAVFSHGTGMLTDSATNSIPSLDSDFNTWLTSNNYPFSLTASRISSSPFSMEVPKVLFQEFNIIAPNNDNPTGDATGEHFPVWISRIVRDDAAANNITMIFSTYNTTEGSPSTEPIEFAQLQLPRSGSSGEVYEIEPIAHLLLIDSTSDDFRQGFGHGSVTLSSLWDETSGEVQDFFDSFLSLVGDPVEFTFSMSAMKLSTFAISRSPKTIPTAGESQALAGSTSGLDSPIYPSQNNRYVTEQDQGVGDTIDFSTHPDLPESKREHDAIERFGQTGALCHRIVRLVVDESDDSLNYNDDILPRLTILLGRAPQFGDMWYSSRFKIFNGDTWQG